MPKNLVIVESPAKAKTIEKYLGSDYVVKSSIGHIRSLPSKNGSIDVANNFKPTFQIDPDKKKIIAELKKAVASAKSVLLASDEDREGEAIAWHLSEVLKLDPATTKRIVFHEITKDALDGAISNPRTIDMPLVEAQQARQALDYLVGFELSPVLWRKVAPKLSAGRVQSVAVRLIVDREREIESHLPESSFKISANFESVNGDELKAEASGKLATAEEVKQLFNIYKDSKFSVVDVAKKPGSRNPSAPFITSSLQQEAAARLGYSPRTTMQLAQRLYEAGHITYMRTDSLNLSKQFLGAATSYIKKEFGDNYHQFRTFKTKSSGAQEAHEAIRPTDPSRKTAGADEQQNKLYNLIWRRTLASQMAPAVVEKTEVVVESSGSKPVRLVAKGEVLTFDGFIRVYGRSGDDTLLPNLKTGDKLILNSAESIEALSRGPARYTEATLVKALEERGIGRPSTYASIISTIQSREYVERTDVEGVQREIRHITLAQGTISDRSETFEYGKDSNKLVPTDRGQVVTDFLVKHFGEVVDYDFTKSIEQELDDVADSTKTRLEVLNDFYGPFSRLVKASDDISRSEAAQARLVGQDPKSKKPIYARFGRFGPMLQLGEQGDESDKPQFASLPRGEKIETISLEKALKAFELPRLVGHTASGEEIKANIGRFGPYIQIGKLFVSIKPHDPHDITLEESLELYKAKLKAEKEKFIAKFGDIQVLKGRYGPYVTDGKKNATIPKTQDPTKLTEAEARKILDEAPAKKGRFTRRKKK
ncbi:type I DNA topoisomerase [Candidatus Saccharibacteria bacterium]|nr:MAG: type I DNA topoisomerase [Candidatus Saccharibacteria bacterium]